MYTVFDGKAYLINLFVNHYSFFVNCDLISLKVLKLACPKNDPTFFILVIKNVASCF